MEVGVLPWVVRLRSVGLHIFNQAFQRGQESLPWGLCESEWRCFWQVVLAKVGLWPVFLQLILSLFIHMVH